MSTFKTEKGTELPIMLIKGKEYLQVAHRLVWFREEHPDYQIATELVTYDHEQRYAIVKATVSDSSGSILAQAYKTENAAGFPDWLEKAETGAIGRALAMCGYGTQFTADELDEGNRLADSPMQRIPQSKSVGVQEKPTIPNGTHTVVVQDEKKGTKNGKQWQRVNTDLGAAWNNSGTMLDSHEQYTVTVENGSILSIEQVDWNNFEEE